MMMRLHRNMIFPVGKYRNVDYVILSQYDIITSQCRLCDTIAK